MIPGQGESAVLAPLDCFIKIVVEEPVSDQKKAAPGAA
jgi:hypothetical protein